VGFCLNTDYCTQVSEVWKTYELDMINYQNKCRLIRGWDDLFTRVKEHINSVAAMKLSPYYKVSSQLFLCTVIVLFELLVSTGFCCCCCYYYDAYSLYQLVLDATCCEANV